MNYRNILGRTSSAFSAKINKPEKLNLLRPLTKRVAPVRPTPIPPKPPAPIPEPEEPEPIEERDVIQPVIEEDAISIKEGESVLYRSGFDPNHIRFVQILKETTSPDSTEKTLELVENYTIEFIDPYITKITAGQDIIDCIIRIYFCEPTLVGVLEKVGANEKYDYDNKIIEWDMNVDWELWEAEILKLDIGEPFLNGIYSSKNFVFVIKGQDGIEYTFQKEESIQ